MIDKKIFAAGIFVLILSVCGIYIYSADEPYPLENIRALSKKIAEDMIENGSIVSTQDELKMYLKASSKAIIQLESSGKIENIHVGRNYELSGGTPGNSTSYGKELNKSEYMELIKTAANSSDLSGITIGDFSYMNARIINHYARYGKLPGKIWLLPQTDEKIGLDGNVVDGEIGYFIIPTVFSQSDDPYVILLAANVTQNTADKRIKAMKLLEWMEESINYSSALTYKKSQDIISEGEGKCTDYSNLYVALCRSAGIPARVVHGYVGLENDELQGGRIGLSDMGFAVGKENDTTYFGHAWTEIYAEDGWITVDPTNGIFGSDEFCSAFANVKNVIKTSWRDELLSHMEYMGAR